MHEMKRLTLGIFATNCYVIRHESDIYVIDPADQPQEILQEAKKLGGVEITVLLTHGHFDHILAAEALRPKAIYAHPLETDALTDPMMNASVYAGMRFSLHQPVLPINEGEKIGPFLVLNTPGHRPGSLCFFDEEMGVLYSGDTLFAGGFGRLDLPGAEPECMLPSLKKLFELPGETVVYPGHGEKTTIRREAEGMA